MKSIAKVKGIKKTYRCLAKYLYGFTTNEKIFFNSDLITMLILLANDNNFCYWYSFVEDDEEIAKLIPITCDGKGRCYQKYFNNKIQGCLNFRGGECSLDILIHDPNLEAIVRRSFELGFQLLCQKQPTLPEPNELVTEFDINRGAYL
jgi:hypothetical protein